ncbi:uncharacterized protein LOC119954235 [Scyliorhinus canicula]|uniref:uncharacterized protein LOC119954235 n=1 Tax=Scyliorhinus canicula TaxID=7830 RepID=UPI0018F27D50|nr:uncharacterized protein LOC119954235 [Scyliorhinus canicula]XP_038635236.1 uncharacterized protein LOC119954235 [Scyliorhinus canicula]
MDRTVQVSPLPTGISKQSLEDKLMIHFLRSKNGGGEIIDILFPPESPTSALITFEEAEVAQRVLGVENHVLEINGEHHKLKVESACTEIKVDQVILHVSMTINYGKLLGGKKLMRHFQKMDRDIQFRFDQKAEQCNVAGTFAAIQKLSGAIHQLLNLNPSQTNSDSNEAEQHHREGLQNSVPGRSSSFRKVEQKSIADSSSKGEHLELQTKTRVQSFAQSGVGRDTDLQQGSERQTRNFEDYTLLMDSDIYGYIQKFYKDGYQDILRQYLVKVVDFTSEDVTTLILQEASDCPDSKVSLPQAHQELSKLYQNFEFRLRKEQISKKDITSDISVLQNIYASLQIQFAKINFSENENYFYLIGTSDDCSLAKKCLEDLKKEVAGRSPKGKHPASSRDSESRRARDSHIPQPLRDGNEHSEQVGVSKADSKKDHKLAPTFSGLGEKVSPLKAGSRLAEGNLLLKPEQAHTASSFFTGYRMETNPQDVKYLLYSEMQQKPRHCTTDSEMFTSAGEALTSGTGESVVPRKTEEDSFLKTYKDFSVFSGQSKDLKSPGQTDDNILFKSHEGSSIVGTNKVDKLFQSAKGNKTHGPIKPYHFETSAGTLFHQGDLLSDTHTLQSLTTTTGSEGHTFKPSLRRTNSFSEYSKSKYSRDFSDSFQGIPKVNPVEQVHITEEIPMESVVWSYLKDIYDSSIRNIGAETDVMMNEQIQGDITIIKLTALNKANITAAKQAILSLYTMVMKHLVQQFISFTDLGIEDHKAVERWYMGLKKKFPEVKFIIEQTGFKIVATYEHCMKVVETFKSKLKDPVSSTDLGSISASDPCSFTGTDTFTGTEGKDLRRFIERSSFLDQSPHSGKKPNSFHTPAHHVDETSPRESAKTREEHPLFQTDQELIEARGHQKIAGSPKKNWHSQPDVEEEESQKNKKTYSNENSGPASNSRQEHSPLTDQKKSPKPFDEYSQFGFLHDQADYKSQKMSKQIGDGEGVKAKKALPDKFNFNANRVGKESHWCNREDSLHCNKLDSGTQSLPLFSYIGTLVPQQSRDGPHASESATNSGDHTQEQYMQQQEEGSLTTSQEKKTMRNSQQNQPRSPAIGLDAEELNRSASSCASCKKNGRLLKLDCGHSLCKECRTHSQPLCPACDQTVPSIRNENQPMGTMVWTSVNNLVGGKEMMLKITYKILDGIQRECDPNPGQPFTGGLFTAYLPDNRSGNKILKLLVDAFNRGLTFKIVPFPSGSAHVTWNDIPHKTKITGGRYQHGNPDASYCKNVLAALEKHGLQ